MCVTTRSLTFEGSRKAARIYTLRRHAKSCQLVQREKLLKRHPKECKRFAHEGFFMFGTGCAYYHQVKSTLETRINTMETNKRVDNLENLVNEMAEKIVSLESKVREMKSTDKNKVKEAVIQVEDCKEVTKNKYNSKDPKVRKSKNNGSVFKFGAEARKTVSNGIGTPVP